MPIGKSVGAIIKNEKGEYLVLYRRKEPLGLALPAGHIDGKETPEETLRREVLEETGLKVVDLKEVFYGEIPVSRAHCGHSSHQWWVYEARVDGEPELKEPTKHEFVRFMSLEEMRPYVEKLDYDSAWFKYILPALGII